MSNNMIRKYCMTFCGVIFLLAASCEIAAQAPKPAAKPEPAKPVPAVAPETQKRFDASKPVLTEAMVDDVIRRFKDLILNKNLPANIKHNKQEDFITLSHIDDIEIRLDFIAKHPDLEEVTGVSKVWYENLLPGVHQYMRELAIKMDSARLNGNDVKYQQAKAAFEASQKDFLAYLAKTPGPKFDKEAMRKIKAANYKRREKEYAEQIKKAQPAGK